MTLSEVLADETCATAEQFEEKEQTRILRIQINALPERERLLLSLYYHEELTLREIGHVLGIQIAPLSAALDGDSAAARGDGSRGAATTSRGAASIGRPRIIRGFSRLRRRLGRTRNG